MANTYYDSQLTAEEIEEVLEAINGILNPVNNGKVLAISNGKFEARSVQWGGGSTLEPLSVTANGNYYPEAGVDGFDEVYVSVPNSYTASDEGKVVSNGALAAQTARSSQITQNGTYDTTLNNEVTVNVSGGGSVTEYSICNIGFFSDPSGPTLSSIQLAISGHQGEYAIICVMHRGTLTPPSGCELLTSTKSSYGDQWVSIYKCYLNSQAVTLTFSQNPTGRMCATVWAINTDYSLNYSETIAFQFYLNDAVIQTTNLTFVVFNSFYAQTNGISYPISDGAWICRANTDVMQYRHFSGVIPSSTSQKTTHIKQGTNVSPADTWGEIVVYSIIPE